MTTEKVQTYYAKMEEAKLGDFVLNVHDKMQANPAFAKPSPTLAELKGALQTYVAARTLALEQKSPVNTERKNVTKEVLTTLLSRLATYVNLTANGDVAALLSSGFTLYTPRSAVGVLPAPHDVRIGDGFDKGSLRLTFTKVDRANGYLIAYTDDPALPLAQWQKKLTTRTHEEVTGLTRGGEYHFRVAATSAAADQTETYVFSEVVSRVSQ